MRQEHFAHEVIHLRASLAQSDSSRFTAGEPLPRNDSHASNFVHSRCVAMGPSNLQPVVRLQSVWVWSGPWTVYQLGTRHLDMVDFDTCGCIAIVL